MTYCSRLDCRSTTCAIFAVELWKVASWSQSMVFRIRGNMTYIPEYSLKITDISLCMKNKTWYGEGEIQLLCNILEKKRMLQESDKVRSRLWKARLFRCCAFFCIFLFQFLFIYFLCLFILWWFFFFFFVCVSTVLFFFLSFLTLHYMSLPAIIVLFYAALTKDVYKLLCF